MSEPLLPEQEPTVDDVRPSQQLPHLSSELRPESSFGVDREARSLPPLIAIDTTKDPSSGTSPELSRYKQVRFHARGGIGEVYIAEDIELHRFVALKRMQLQHSEEPENRRRFLLEAEITGRLEHPGIVPVYGLLHAADGQPYYAMRFIEGESLKQAIARFHTEQANRPPVLAFKSLAFRQLLQRFVAVCNAVAFAHSRGIVHRDLKPENIMLGKYGETLVVDWGLAKPFARTELERATGEVTLTPMCGREGSTQMGQAMGTPAYMSPEQAAGRWDQIGPASDIYSLGATLYCLLTGRVPFQEAVLGLLLVQKEQGDFRAPEHVNPAVPPPLAAICLKAMAPKPSARYATALDLAADLDGWLADEPVAAHRESAKQRFFRLWRRYPRRFAFAYAMIMTLYVMVLSGIGLWTVSHTRDADSERDQAMGDQRWAAFVLNEFADAPNRAGADYFRLAQVFAAAAVNAEFAASQNPVPSNRKGAAEEAKLFTSRTIEMVQKAQTSGFFDTDSSDKLAILKQLRGFNSLMRRDDFRKTVQEIEGKAMLQR